jgi:hypothetical protein
MDFSRIRVPGSSSFTLSSYGGQGKPGVLPRAPPPQANEVGHRWPRASGAMTDGQPKGWMVTATTGLAPVERSSP